MVSQLSTLSCRDDLHKVGQSLSATNQNLHELDGNLVHTQDCLEFVREQQKIMISESAKFSDGNVAHIHHKHRARDGEGVKGSVNLLPLHQASTQLTKLHSRCEVCRRRR
jgi:hypothetical protein